MRKFLHLPGAQQRLILQAAILLGATKIGLRILPFRTVRSLLTKATNTSIRLQKTERAPIETIVWAVEKAGRRMPKVSTCLTQALATQALLAQRNYPALLHIGVLKDEEGRLKAHAWVECRDQVVIGGYDLERYTHLTMLGDQRS